MVNRLLVILAMAGLLLSGCARYVTDKTITDSAGNVISPSTKMMEVTIALNGVPFSGPSQMYYIAYSTSENFRLVPSTYVDDGAHYFVLPGKGRVIDYPQNFRDAYFGGADKDLDEVYKQCFVSWNAYVSYNPARDIQITSGPFVSSANVVSPRNFGARDKTIAGKKYIVLIMPVPADVFYMQILTVEGNILRDYLGQNKKIIYNDGAVIAESTSKWTAATGAMDIVSFNIRTYTE